MLRVYLPETAQDVLDKAPDIDYLTSLDPFRDPDNIRWLATVPHSIYLFYDGSEPVGMIRLDDRMVDPALGKNTVEIHGGFTPEGLQFSDRASKLVIEAAFKVKKTIIAKVPPSNKGAIGWCRKWGFKRINWEAGKAVYRLKRSEYTRGI